MAMVLTIKEAGVLQRLSRRLSNGGESSISRSESRRLPIIRLARMAVGKLKDAGVNDAHIASLAETHVYMRATHDLANLQEYYERIADFDPNQELTREVLQRINPWPEYLLERDSDRCISDLTGHAFVRVTNMPGIVLANMMSGLYSSEVRRINIAVIGETVRGRVEETVTNRLSGLAEAVDEWSGRISQSRRGEARRRGLQEREEQVFESGWSVTYNVIIDVFFTDPTSLEDDLNLIDQELNSLISTGKPVTGAAYQLPMLWSMTGISVL
jgi:hypothetical protein